MTPDLSRLPPQAPDIEQAVLGALLLEPSAWLSVADILSPECFHSDANALIYKAAQTLWHNGHPVDLLTVAQALRSDGKLDEVGGPFYLSQLTSKVSSTVNLEYHARILQQHLIARRLIVAGQWMRDSAYGAVDAFDTLDKASSLITKIYGIAQPNESTSAARDLAGLTDGPPPEYHLSGIDALDEVIRFEKGLPVVMAGRPGIGKSIAACEVVWHWTLKGPAMLFSPEMTLRQVQARIISRESGVPYRDILRRTMTAQQMQDVFDTTERIGDRLSLLKVDTTAGITPTQMRVRLERAMKRDGVQAFAIDHLHEMRTGDAKADRSIYERVSICMGAVTQLAKDVNLPNLTMCQLSREASKGIRKDEDAGPPRRPSLTDLKGAGEIEEKAAVVVLLHSDGYYRLERPYVDDLELMVEKNRDGDLKVCHAPITRALSRIGQSSVPLTEDKVPF